MQLKAGRVRGPLFDNKKNILWPKKGTRRINLKEQII